MVTDPDIGPLVSRTARAFLRVAEAKLRPLGLSVAHTPVLVHLADEGPLTQTEIAQRLHVEQPTAAALLQRMARAGLIERSPDARDGRATRISLTDHAREVLPRALDLRAATERAATADLTESETDLLRQLLRRVMANLDEMVARNRPASGN